MKKKLPKKPKRGSIEELDAKLAKVLGNESPTPYERLESAFASLMDAATELGKAMDELRKK